MFCSNGGKGFSMSFASGLTISVQFGYGNYCENRVTNNFIDCHGDDVIGYLSADQVAALIAKVASVHE